VAYIFDIETNGLLDTLTTIHSLVLKDPDSGRVWSLHGDKIPQGLSLLQEADELIGHNIIKFDIPALTKLYPTFKPKGRLLDTLILSRLMWPQIEESDYGLVGKKILPKRLLGRYSLEAFGYRLRRWKGDYAEICKDKGIDPWASWSRQMQDYCEQDVEVTHALYDRACRVWAGYDSATVKELEACKRTGVHPDTIPITPHSDRSIWLEMDVARILERQERWGFTFDVERGEQFYIELIREREVLEQQLKQIFGSWFEADGAPVTIKRTRRVNCPVTKTKILYEKGSTYTKIKFTQFNPSSTSHIAKRLSKLYGWQPQEFTPSGRPKVDESVLSKLPYGEAKLLSRYMLIAKRIAQLAEGSQAWLKKERQGRIHGSVMSVGAVTRRMTHSNPNMAQVPSSASPFGEQCRSLFRAREGYVLVGCDADALELRCLAGYMARYDGGDYINTILKGDKAQGTDMHSVNARALGLDPLKTYPIETRQISGRDIAKVWFYAFLYGAGDFKLGTIMGSEGTDNKIAAAGKHSRSQFLTSLPALKVLTEQVKSLATTRGYLKSLDGGKLVVRSQHGALNTLLQSAGAIIMKQALVILDQDLQTQGLIPSSDYEFCANVHDEWQIDVLPHHAELVMNLSQDSIRKAGEVLKFACPLQGNASQGLTWRDTH